MQSDLFNLSISNSFERQAFQRSFFEKKYTLRLDQLLGCGLVTIVFFVLVFAWGVEHGKADSRREFMLQAQSASELEKAIELPAVPQPIVAAVMPLTAPTVEMAVENLTEVSAPAPNPHSIAAVDSTSFAKPKYTIAHVTYVKKSQALSEIERIKSKGYEAFLVPSGKYYQICVNGFESRKNANETIKTLRLKGVVSADSYIRNMPASN